MTRTDRPYGSLFDHESGTFLAPAEFKHLLAATVNPDLTFVLDQDTYEPVYGPPTRPSHLIVRVRHYHPEKLQLATEGVAQYLLENDSDGTYVEAALRSLPRDQLETVAEHLGITREYGSHDDGKSQAGPPQVAIAWWTAGIALVIAAFLLLSGPKILADNGYTYACPSPANMALNPDYINVYINGTGPEDLPVPSDAEYDGLANAPGVWRKCRAHNMLYGIAGLLALTVTATAGTWGALARCRRP